MKQFLFVAAFALALFSCSGNRQQGDALAVAYDLDNLLAVAEEQVENTVTVVGFVTHTCKHSGQKCFIVGESQAISLQVNVDPEGEIGSFNPELMGSKLAITGILKEHHVLGESIDQMESNALQTLEEGGSPEACAAELNNVSEMRQWMLDRGKDYFVIYYMDGLTYEVLD